MKRLVNGSILALMIFILAAVITPKEQPMTGYAKYQETPRLEIIYTPLENDCIVCLREQNETWPYGLYTKNGYVEVIVNGERMQLSQALDEHILTITEILEQAKLDSELGIAQWERSEEGTKERYEYKNFAIVIDHTEVGSETLYIGEPRMAIHETN